ncbi:hypothetical protein NL676_017956 [Syzygium grande]|nr:hypothetical protein NL676_017956 [Syzygium grande]
MMAFVTATAAVASSSIAIRSFRAHKPSLTPDLDEVGRRSTSCRSGRGRAAPPMAARPHRHPSSSIATRPFRAHKPSLAPDLDEVGRCSTSCRSGAAGGGLVDCVVVGGENSGLCIAQALTTKHRDKAPDVVVTEARDRVDVLLLQVEPRKYSIYREAVVAISTRYLPWLLRNAFGDPWLIFAGVRIASDTMKLSEDYNLKVEMAVDLVKLAMKETK